MDFRRPRDGVLYDGGARPRFTSHWGLRPVFTTPTGTSDCVATLCSSYGLRSQQFSVKSVDNGALVQTTDLLLFSLTRESVIGRIRPRLSGGVLSQRCL